MSQIKFVILLVLASACIAVAQDKSNATLDGPFQIRYASNLAQGDSVVDLTNSGASNANICANVYTFDPSAELVSCCSCMIAPNALESLSVRNDLISNTATPGIPTSVVIKVLSTISSNNTCNAGNQANTQPLATGLLAWGTTEHAQTAAAAGTYEVTETAFSPATLNFYERQRITSLCANIQTNGSGFGICRSCRLGGL